MAEVNLTDVEVIVKSMKRPKEVFPRPGNRAKFDLEVADYLKENFGVSELPEVDLDPGGDDLQAVDSNF